MTLDQLLKQAEEEFVETGADLEHARWARWQSYMFSKCQKLEDGSIVIPRELVERWQRQIDTPYHALSEKEKDSDREQVRDYIPLLISKLTEAWEAGWTDGKTEAHNWNDFPSLGQAIIEARSQAYKEGFEEGNRNICSWCGGTPTEECLYCGGDTKAKCYCVDGAINGIESIRSQAKVDRTGEMLKELESRRLLEVAVDPERLHQKRHFNEALDKVIEIVKTFPQDTKE